MNRVKFIFLFILIFSAVGMGCRSDTGPASGGHESNGDVGQGGDGKRNEDKKENGKKDGETDPALVSGD